MASDCRQNFGCDQIHCASPHPTEPNDKDGAQSVTRNLTYFLSHPIQYQSPLLRRLALEDDLSFRVVYEHNFSTRTYFDQGFQSDIRWDIPLREGYRSDLLADVSVSEVLRESDAVWFHGWQSKHLRRILKDAARLRKSTLMRGENWFGAMPDGDGEQMHNVTTVTIRKNCERR